MDNAILSWKRLIPVLAESYRVFAIDWPKQGKSSPWSGLADHDFLVKCVDIVRTHFDLKKVMLVGLSQGGAITLAYTILNPDKVEKIVVLAPGGIIRFPPVIHQLLWLSAKLPWLTKSISKLYFVNRRKTEKASKAILIEPPSDFDEIVDEVMLEAANNGAGATDWQNNSIGFLRMKVYLVPELHKITCPCLFIQGVKDVAISPKQAAKAAGHIPTAKFVLLENTGHWPNRQSPEKVNRMILDFLNNN
jgi:pimeloyl-ACP methyl ester carboxylesterase